MTGEMRKSLDAFNAQVTRFLKEVPKEKIRAMQRGIALSALGKLVEKTPADYGRARGNWQVTIGVPTFTALEVEDKAGSETISKGSADILAALGEFEVIFLQNNLPYIEVLENGGFIPPDPGPSKDRRPDRKGKTLVVKGYSTQAPNGMLKVTFQEIVDGLSG